MWLETGVILYPPSGLLAQVEGGYMARAMHTWCGDILART
jgi:hypothetical protein